jgi:hypothetical protein
MKSFHQARLKYRVKLAQARLDSEARDKGKAKVADEKEVAQEENPYGLYTGTQKGRSYGAIRIGKSVSDVKDAVFGTFRSR